MPTDNGILTIVLLFAFGTRSIKPRWAVRVRASGGKNNGTVRKIDLWQLTKDQYMRKGAQILFSRSPSSACLSEVFSLLVNGKNRFSLSSSILAVTRRSPQNYYFFLRCSWALLFLLAITTCLYSLHMLTETLSHQNLLELVFVFLPSHLSKWYFTLK